MTLIHQISASRRGRDKYTELIEPTIIININHKTHTPMNNKLRDLFQQPFDLVTYRSVILSQLLHAQRLLTSPEMLEQYDNGDQLYGLGYLTDNEGKEIGLYYTHVPNGDVRRKRVGFRKMLHPYVKYGVDAAIAVFDDGEYWRLSYICDLKGGVTSAKRFSYVFGDPKGQYNTPVGRLTDLGKKRLTLDELHKTFSVDALSKEFFDEYHRHYDRIIAELSRQGNTGAVFHDYVKKMMGRIVFLHFLQKKRWLNDDPEFLSKLFFLSPYKQDFLDQELEPLFFGIFNTEPDKREQLFHQEHWDLRWLAEWEKLPYLNGGLFERDEVDKMKIKLPASLFEQLFEFMASYNFTIDENDPDDADIGIDPEMLGKIFESLLEDNKAKGAFYTPKEIVRYMCKESLIAYLETKVSDNASEMLDIKQSIRTFVEHHELPEELEPYREVLDTALRDVKICDPAIGSGAFPMGLLNELWRCREAIENVPDELDLAYRAELKKEIIENNIYGVDIERGAIDIARLRFWLSIVVDAEKPEPLPNFDYKFMQGNSLIESFWGYDLSHIMDKKVERNGKTYYQRRIVGKESVQVSIDFSTEDTRKNLKIWLSKYFSLTDHQEKSEYRKRINESVKSYIKQQFIGSSDKAKLDNFDPSANKDFFLWHTWFKDIFDYGGFDIVIGNPPYGAKTTDSDKRYYKQRYYCATSHPNQGQKGSTDTFAVFIELGHSILCPSGYLAFIVPMSVGSSDAMTALQYVIEKTCSEIRVSSYSNRPKQIFDAACVRTSIFMFKKSSKPLEHIYTTKLNRRTESNTIKDIIDNLQFIDSKTLKLPGRYAKIGTQTELQLLSNLFRFKKRIADYICDSGKDVYYRAAGGRYFNVVTNYPTYSSAEKSFKCSFTDVIGLIMSSSYFYFYQQVYTDGLNLKRSEIDNYPLPDLSKLSNDSLAKLSELYSNYLEDIERNAAIRISSNTSTHNIDSFKEYKIVRSKNIISEIDEVVGHLYALSSDEIKFIKNYEIKYRMAGE